MPFSKSCCDVRAVLEKGTVAAMPVAVAVAMAMAMVMVMVLTVAARAHLSLAQVAAA